MSFHTWYLKLNCYEFLDMCIFMVVYKIQSLLEILHARNNLFQINRNEKIHTFFLFFIVRVTILYWSSHGTHVPCLCLTPPLPFFILEKYYDPIEFATESNYLCFFQSKVQRNWFWLKIIFWGWGGGYNPVHKYICWIVDKIRGNTSVVICIRIPCNIL